MVLVWDVSWWDRQCCRDTPLHISKKDKKKKKTRANRQRRQMCGRAGRKGKDEAGETYLICGKSELQAVCDLLEAGMPAIESCLAPEKRGLKR